MRTFETGATRDQDETKPDYEGFLSPLVTKRFGEYMTLHRKQADGNLRASDNWQKGIPRDAYIKSLCRHVEDLRLHHDGFPDEATDQDIESVLCAIMFNVQGYLFEFLMAAYHNRLEPGPAPKNIFGQTAAEFDNFIEGFRSRTPLERKLGINQPDPPLCQTVGSIYRPCDECQGCGLTGDATQNVHTICPRCKGDKVLKIGQDNR